MRKPVFTIFPEIYVLVDEHRHDDRFSEEQKKRMLEIVSTWEAALQEHGDRVDKVELYYDPPEEDETGLSFHAFQIDESLKAEGRHWR